MSVLPHPAPVSAMISGSWTVPCYAAWRRGFWLICRAGRPGRPWSTTGCPQWARAEPWSCAQSWSIACWARYTAWREGVYRPGSHHKTPSREGLLRSCLKPLPWMTKKRSKCPGSARGLFFRKEWVLCHLEILEQRETMWYTGNSTGFWLGEPAVKSWPRRQFTSCVTSGESRSLWASAPSSVQWVTDTPLWGFNESFTNGKALGTCPLLPLLLPFCLLWVATWICCSLRFLKGKYDLIYKNKIV